MALRPPTDVLTRTPIYRMVHIDCLATLAKRGALHAPSCVPNDGLPYKSIHDVQTQATRARLSVPCGPRGVIQDYVGFYLGPRSPMLLRLKTGWNVAQVDQSDIVYLVTTAQFVDGEGHGFVFTDRHSLVSGLVKYFDRLTDLSRIDFPAAYAERWSVKLTNDPSSEEKKQAEFLVHQQVPWDLIKLIAVFDNVAEQKVRRILAGIPGATLPKTRVCPAWYY